MPDAETLAEPTLEPFAADPGGDADAPATLQAPLAAMPAKSKDKKGKDKKQKKGKDKAPAQPGDGPSIAGHPRAARSVERAKAWGALVGFILGGYLSLPTHTVADAGLRALAAGAILYVAVWAGAVFVWRRLVVVEIRAREAAALAAAQASIARRQGAVEPARAQGQTAGR
jgi:hypothetical protein